MHANRKLTARTGLLLTALAFIAVILFANTVLRGWRLDLTENNIYTLSDGTRQVLGKLEEPVTLRFFFSDKLAQGLPSIQSYATRVEELLEEFAEASDGKIKLRLIDPEPFSEAEDEAAGFGLSAATVNTAGDKLYFGLAGTNSIGDEVIIAFFQPDKEAFLEYEVAKLVYELAHPQKTVVGLISHLPVMGGGQPNPYTRETPGPWVAFQQIQQLFELRQLDEAAGPIPDDVDVLMVVHPKTLDDSVLYAIDQYLMRGGHAILFTDPLAERDQGDGLSQPLRISSLNKLYRAWGFEQADNEVIGDLGYALNVQVSQDRSPTTHLALIGLDGEALSDDDVVVRDLQVVNLGSTGYFRKLGPAEGEDAAEQPEVELLPLLQSSDSAQPIDAGRIHFLPDPAALLDNFQPTGERYTLAARIQAELPSAFDGFPAEMDAEQQARFGEHRSASDGPANLIIVADTDILSDRLWVQLQNFLGQQVATPWASNLDFAINALDSLAGSDDLISIRSRGVFARPFDRVDELRRDAEGQFRAKEQELEARLRQTEQRLTELQAGGEEGGLLSLTPEQEQALEEFRDEQLEIRKQLRDVRHRLDRDIEQLGTRLKLVNILAVPLLIGLFALVRAWRRRRQAASGQEAAA